MRSAETHLCERKHMLRYLLLRPFASMPMKTSEPISDVSITYGASLAYRNFEFYKIYIFDNFTFDFVFLHLSMMHDFVNFVLQFVPIRLIALHKRPSTHREHVHRQL